MGEAISPYGPAKIKVHKDGISVLMPIPLPLPERTIELRSWICPKCKKLRLTQDSNDLSKVYCPDCNSTFKLTENV